MQSFSFTRPGKAHATVTDFATRQPLPCYPKQQMPDDPYDYLPIDQSQATTMSSFKTPHTLVEERKTLVDSPVQTRLSQPISSEPRETSLSEVNRSPISPVTTMTAQSRPKSERPLTQDSQVIQNIDQATVFTLNTCPITTADPGSVSAKEFKNPIVDKPKKATTVVFKHGSRQAIYVLPEHSTLEVILNNCDIQPDGVIYPDIALHQKIEKLKKEKKRLKALSTTQREEFASFRRSHDQQVQLLQPVKHPDPSTNLQPLVLRYMQDQANHRDQVGQVVQDLQTNQVRVANIASQHILMLVFGVIIAFLVIIKYLLDALMIRRF